MNLSKKFVAGFVSAISAAVVFAGTFVGPQFFTDTITSKAPSGTAPFAVTSTTLNANLNADLLDGLDSTYVLNAGNLSAGTLLAARMPALTGDITTSAGAVATTLATVNSNVGTYGSATAVPTVVVNGKGLVTAATNVTITPAVGSITGLGTGVGTALAVNVGSAGAPVVNGGALGTPSSGNLANATGLPSSSIVAAENTQTGTTYTLASTDNGKVVTLNNASAITLTVPTLSAGFVCTIVQKGAGQVTVTGSGATINNAHGQSKTYGQHAVVTLYGTSSTTFVLAGDTGT